MVLIPVHFSRYILLVLFLLEFSVADAAQHQKAWKLKSVRTSSGQVTSFLDFQPPSGIYTRGVVIMPPTGGVSFLEKSYAKALVKRGARVAVVKRWTYDDETSIDLEIHQKLFKRTLTALFAVSGVFPEDTPITVMGASLGGMSAAMGASLSDRFDRVMVIAAGGPYASVIAESNQKDLQKARELRFARFGFETIDDYTSAIEDVFDLGPFVMAPNFKNKARGMIILTQDQSVPTMYQEKLFKLWNPEFVRRIENTHIPGIIEARVRYFKEILNFVFPESVRP